LKVLKGDRHVLRAHKVLPAGGFDAETAVDRVTLDYDGRHRRRVALAGDGGLAFLLDLPEVQVFRDGDGLLLEDGRVVLVRAAEEAVADITCDTPEALVRIAWHLGNRHLPTQLLAGRLRIRDDHVIVAMAQGLGAAVRRLRAPFDPEGGAYAHRHGHDGPPADPPSDLAGKRENGHA
jgi:urease accessory protein